MKNASTFVVVSASFAIGVALTMLAIQAFDRSSARGGGARSAESGGPTSRTVEIATLETRLQQSEATNAALRSEVETLRARIEEQQRVERERATPRHAQASAREPRFVYPKMEQGLRTADWEALGGATSRLMPLLSEAQEVSVGKRPMRPALWGEIMAEVGPIVTNAIEISSNGVAWESPAVLVNLVHATLREGGQPLTGPQEEDLDRIGLRYIEEDSRRLAAYPDETCALEKRIDTVRLQDRAYAAIVPILNDAQRAVLYPPGVRGVIGLDIFAGSITWDEHWDPMPHAGRAGLREVVTAGYCEHLRPELAPEVGRIVADWEARLPDSFVLAKPTPQRLMNKDMESSARILATADYQLALMKTMLAQLPLDAQERQMLLDIDRVYVPILK